MKRFGILLLCLVSLVLFACSKESPETLPAESVSDETETHEASRTETKEEPLFPAPTEPVTDEEHRHDFHIQSVRESTCTSEGLRRLVCACGQQQEEVLPILSHVFSAASCESAPVCSLCGAKGQVKGHEMQGNACVLCGLQVKEPIFVLGRALAYDQTISEIRALLGEPTETLHEGELVSLVYAADLSRLTVIQTDSVGLWGVFTMDRAAFFQPGGNLVNTANFSGRQDTLSDALYRDQGSCRIYGFRDTLGGGDYYGLWLRYSEYDYDFSTDPRIVSDYTAQSRLSYYYVNALRARHGLPPLSWSTQAATASRNYARKMATEDFFDHDGLYGVRLQEQGVVWKSCGENISHGYTSALFVCDAYYNCLPHRENILSASFAYVGMGFSLQKGTGMSFVLGAQTFYS